jgi:ABC-type phosphate transport system substrate-binding protein
MKWVFLSICLIAFVPYSQAKVAVIVHPANNIELDKEDVRKIFFGKRTFFESQKIHVVSRDRGSEAYDIFNNDFLEKSNSQYMSLWAKIIFTGKGKPPTEMSDDESVIDAISDDKYSIGYIEESNLDGSVKVVMFID